MNVDLNSLSSSLILGTTLYRNKGGISNKIIGQAGYALCAAVAVIETITALAFSILSLLIYPLFSTAPWEHSTKWLSSSAFTLVWSLADFLLNLFVVRLVADENSARQILASGNIMIIPPGAIV